MDDPRARGRADSDAVFVEAAARLHFGVLDLGGSLGRWFGGLGAAAPAPTVLVSAETATELLAEGEDAARAAMFASRFLAHHGIKRGARLRIHRALPPHKGLGSGTQLGLAVARCLAELFDLPAQSPELARAVGRAERSAVGTWTFANGGFVVEGGRPLGRDDSGPLITRLPFPPSWHCIVAVPHTASDVSGETEAQAFRQLPKPSEAEVQRVAYVVLMALLPALVDADLPAFGAALEEVQTITGGWFASVQGGVFAPGLSEDLIHELHASGATGVGQSSWGPAVYGIVDGPQRSQAVSAGIQGWLGDRGVVHAGPFRRSGARVWRSHGLAEAP